MQPGIHWIPIFAPLCRLPTSWSVRWMWMILQIYLCRQPSWSRYHTSFASSCWIQNCWTVWIRLSSRNCTALANRTIYRLSLNDDHHDASENSCYSSRHPSPIYPVSSTGLQRLQTSVSASPPNPSMRSIVLACNERLGQILFRRYNQHILIDMLTSRWRAGAGVVFNVPDSEFDMRDERLDELEGEGLVFTSSFDDAHIGMVPEHLQFKSSYW
ncbi:hypothetical protein B0H14DRAFT_562641 [Mycena olivaceomarginata]|nr:hypothetical protein B0H14DRAFT_562641 [Mycena olivaceomarginata]